MSAHVELIGRTARILKPYSVTQRNGRNGAFESRMVMFSIATDRDYKQAVVSEDGTIAQERKTDFFACRATGPVADLFAKYCSATKLDENGNEKLVSRRIQVRGHLEKYPATRTENIQANVNGQIINLQAQLPEEREVLVVENIEFLDADPAKRNNSNTTTATAGVITAQVATEAIPAQPMQAVAPTVTASAVPTQGAPVVQQAVLPF